MSNKVTDVMMNMIGEKGYTFISDTSTYTADYCCIFPLTTVVLDTVTGNGTGQDGGTLPAGIPLFGKFTSVKLTSGTAVLYKR